MKMESVWDLAMEAEMSARMPAMARHAQIHSAPAWIGRSAPLWPGWRPGRIPRPSNRRWAISLMVKIRFPC
jgi:hypothetical protein